MLGTKARKHYQNEKKVGHNTRFRYIVATEGLATLVRSSAASSVDCYTPQVYPSPQLHLVSIYCSSIFLLSQPDF